MYTVYSNELYHHGILGQKWGVRRFQNEDGTLTAAGKKRYSTSDLAKKLADGDFDANTAYKKAEADYDKKIKKIDERYKPKDNEWYNTPGDYRSGYSAKARKYMSETSKAWNEFSREETKFYNKKSKEEATLRQKVFLKSDAKQAMEEARALRKKIDELSNNMVGPNSDAAESAYKQYLNGSPANDDTDYEFFHYKWQPGNAAYDKAWKEYKSQSSKLDAEYDKQITSIGRSVFGEYADMKMNDDWYDTYADFGKQEVDFIIRFKRLS